MQVRRNERSRKARGIKPISGVALPAIKNNISVNMRLRFSSTGTLAISISTLDILDTIVIGNGNGVVGFQLFDNFRLRKVRIYSVGATTDLAKLATMSLQWAGTGSTTGDAMIHSASALGSVPGELVCVPPEGSPASLWHGPGTDENMFTLNLPDQFSAIDLEVEFCVNQTSTPQACTSALVVGTAGQIYYRGLDGLPIASTLLRPVGVITNTA